MKNQGEVLTVYFQVPPGRALVSFESAQPSLATNTLQAQHTAPK